MSKKDKKMIICFFTIWTILMIIFGIVIILYLQSEYNNRLYNTTARIISKIHNEVPEKEAEIKLNNNLFNSFTFSISGSSCTRYINGALSQ